MAEGNCSLTQRRRLKLHISHTSAYAHNPNRLLFIVCDLRDWDSTNSTSLHLLSLGTGLVIYHCLTINTVVLLLAWSIQENFLSSLPWKLLLPPWTVATQSHLKSLISSTLFPSFKVLTTWRLYFLAPKIPAKVLLLIYCGKKTMFLWYLNF